MKKIIYSISVLLTSMFFMRSANAMWPDFTPAIPFAPQLCVMCIPPAISVAISYYDQVVEVKEDLKKYTDMTTLKKMAVSYVSKMGKTAFNRWRESKNSKSRGIAYARTIEECKVADVKSEESVRDAYIKLFMQYPSDKVKTNEAYRTIGDQLKMDTTLEMYLTAVELEKKLYGNTKNAKGNNNSKNMEDLGWLKQIDLIESCLVQGENCDVVGLNSCQEKTGNSSDDTKEDHACFWNSALQAEKFYDEIMRSNLLLIAMDTQYRAVLGINNLAKIMEYKAKEKEKEKTDKSSFLLDKYLQPSFNTAMSRVDATIAFADLTPEEDKEAEAELSSYEETLLSKDEMLDRNFDDADHPDGFTSAISDREEDVKSLEVLREITDDLNKAQKMHNLKQTLPEYKKVYQDYADVREKMNQVQLNLRASGDCIINLLKPYYKYPWKVWLGEECAYYRDRQLVCHYKEGKSAEDESPSQGDFDILCPDNIESKCYVKELRSKNIEGGVAFYLWELYNAAKDEDAAGDTEAFIAVDQKEADGGFGSKAEVTTGGEGSEVKHGEDDLFITSRNSDETMDDDHVEKMTTQTSETDSEEATSTLKDQEEGDKEKEQARKDGLIRWVIGSEVAKEVAYDLDTGKHKWGARKSKFPLWNDQIEFYKQYIDGKYENIEEYISNMSQTDVLLELADKLNEIYPYKAIPGIPPISEETQRKQAKQALKELNDALIEVKEKLFYGEEEEEDDKAIKSLPGLLKIVKKESIPNSQKKAEKEKRAEQMKSLTFEDIDMHRIEEEINQENARIEAVRSEYEKNSEMANKRLTSLYSIMDSANKARSELNATYNKNNEVVKKGDATTPEATEGLDYSRKIYANRRLSQDSPQNAEFNATKTSNEQNSIIARENQSTVGKKAEDYEKIVKNAEEATKKVKESLDEMRRLYVKQLSDTESQEKIRFNEFTEELRASRKIDVWESAMNEIEPLKLSGKLLQCIKDYALNKVAEAKTKIQEMETDLSLYYVSGAEKMNQIHNDMIESISNIPLKDLAECVALGEIKNFDENVEEDVGPVINVFQSVCKDDFCTTPDTDYFVGAVGLPRDLAAPRLPLDISSAPLHEIFHFDMIDFNNVDKYYEDKDDIYSNKKMYTSFESFSKFLEAGSSGFEYGKAVYDSTVPVVWKYILKRHAFVQKEIDLTNLLGEVKTGSTGDIAEENEKMILRGGIFPCIVNQRYMIDAVKPEEIVLPFFIKKKMIKFLYTYNLTDILKQQTGLEKDTDYLPQCQAVSLVPSDNGVSIYDKEAGNYTAIRKLSSLPATFATTQSSELGRIMSYVVDEEALAAAVLRARLLNIEIDQNSLPHRLTFNQTLLNALADINKTEDLTEDDEAARFYLASRLIYDRNQFGDYLDQVEYESVVADTQEKVQKQIDDINGKISEVFIAADYQMSDDFNLLNQDDYDTAAKLMDDQKTLYMDLANQKLRTVPQGNGVSQNVRDKYQRLLHKLQVLQKDSDEIVTVTGKEEFDELEEKIKTQLADKSVSEKYKEKDAEEEERQKKHIQAPFCASYPTRENPFSSIMDETSSPDTSDDNSAEKSAESGDAANGVEVNGNEELNDYEGNVGSEDAETPTISTEDFAEASGPVPAGMIEPRLADGSAAETEEQTGAALARARETAEEAESTSPAAAREITGNIRSMLAAEEASMVETAESVSPAAAKATSASSRGLSSAEATSMVESAERTSSVAAARAAPANRRGLSSAEAMSTRAPAQSASPAAARAASASSRSLSAAETKSTLAPAQSASSAATRAASSSNGALSSVAAVSAVENANSVSSTATRATSANSRRLSSAPTTSEAVKSTSATPAAKRAMSAGGGISTVATKKALERNSIVDKEAIKEDDDLLKEDEDELASPVKTGVTKGWGMVGGGI